jgi:hypothetical protein
MRADGLSSAWTNEPGEKPSSSTEPTKTNQDASGADDGGWGAAAAPSKDGSSEQKTTDIEVDGWGQPIKPADPDDWGNATAGADGAWSNITSPHATPQDETSQKESKPRSGGRGGGKRGRGGEESDSRPGRGGARGRGERGGDRGGRGRGEGRGRGVKTVSDAPPKLPEIPISSTEEVDWAKAADGA